MRNKIVLLTFADLLINLAAGWLVVAFGAPFIAGATFWVKVGVLLTNLLLSIICLVVAIWLRRRRR